MMREIEVKNITIMQTPESDEARELLEEAKQKFRLYFLWCVPAFIVGTILLICGAINAHTLLISLGATFLACFVICCIYYFSRRAAYLSPYIELLRVAISNDKLRHDERIRWRERARLENTEGGKYYSESMSRKTSKLNKKVNEMKSKLASNPDDADKEYK